MDANYDVVLREFMPALKGNLARTMALKYKLKQVEIARLIGVTQAEISKYVNGKQPKGNGIVFDHGSIDKIARYMLSHNEHEAQKAVCSMCPKGMSLSCSLMIR
jgi:predicted transcriptional regulator